MKAWFLKSNDQLWEKVVQLVTGPHAHMELQFSDGKFFSSTRDLGPRFCEYNELFDTDLEDWDIVDLHSTEDDERVVRLLAEMIIRQKEISGKEPSYGMNHILTDFLPLPIAQNTPDKWICSQSCVYVLQSIGLYLGYDPQMMDPHDCWKVLKAELLAWGKLRFVTTQGSVA